MKKHLLFSRVNHDGRTTVERRSNDGQSKGRYSVGLAKLLFTITLLLTLGVGQMWALSDGETWYEGNTPYLYFNNINSNYNGVSLVQGRQYTYGSGGIGSQGYAMTAISNTKLYYIHQGLYDHYTTQCFVDRNGGSGWTDWSSTAVASRVTTYAHNYTNSYNLTYTSDKVYVFTAASSSKNASLTKSVDAASGYSSLNKTITVKAKVSTDGGSSYSTATSPGSLSASSNKFTAYNSCASAQSLSSGTITCGYTATTTLTAADATGYTFRGWYDSSGTRQTTSKTLTIYPTANATYYAYYEENRYSLTFSHNGHGTISVGGSEVSSGSSAYVNYVSTKALVASANTGYDFTGWTKSGTNTDKVTIADMTASGTSTTIKATATGTTVTAGFTAKTTSITIDLNGGSAGDELVTATYDAELPDFTLATKTGGYNLTGYWDDDEGGNKIINADGTLVRNTSYSSDETTSVWKSTSSSLKLYAQWNNFLSVTYDGNENTGGDAPTDATEYASGDVVTVASAPIGMVKTGYSFAGWNTAPGGGGTSYAAGATFNISANTTLYAQWTENKTAVTISASPAGTGTFTVGGVSGTSASVGVTTTATVVATPATDFQFTSWATTNCSVSPTNNRSTTLTGNGSSATGTLTATFTENVASGWYLVGNDFGDSWSTSCTTYPLTKKYRGMEGVFYRRATVSKDKYHCIHNGTNLYKPSSNTHFGGSGWGNKITLNSISANANVQFSAAGTYYIVVDTRGTWPIIWYETSEPTRFNYHSVNVTGVENAKGTCKVTLGSTSGFETSRFANGETFYVTITGVSGYIPTITIGGTPTTWWKEQATYTASGTMSTSDIAVTISYTPTRAVRFAKTTGCKTLTATGPESTSVSDNTKIKDGTEITFHQDNSTGYTFSKWYSNNTGTSGTEYSTDDDDFELTVSSTRYTIYPIYTENMTTVNLVASPTGKGTFTSGEAVSSVSAGVATKPTVTAVPGTGYHLAGTIWSESSDYISLSATNTAATTITATGETGKTVDLTATFTPNTYRVQFHRNGASEATVYQNFTYDVAQNLTTNTYTRTGYTFGGWATSKKRADAGTVDYADEANVSNLTSVNSATFDLYASWNAKSYTVTLNLDEANKGTIAGADGSASVTFDAAPSTIANRPTAANGYSLDGYYTDHDGEGLKVINGDGTWIASVTGYTDGDQKWKHDGDVTLYAYYKKAEITNLVAEPGVIAPGETITITPTIEPTPTGTTKVCYELQYSNGTPLPSQPTFTPGVGNAVSFPVPSASATYIIQATLAKGSSCPADPGDVLSTRTATFQVAGEHTVTVRYQDSDGRTLQASASIEARPLDWTTVGAITPPTITGYTFARWDAGDGVTIKNGDSDPVTTTTTSSIQIKAVYDGTLTAVYNKKNMIYFNNTLGWSDVYVYFYSSDKYWVEDHIAGQGCGTGSDQSYEVGGSAAYYRGYHGHMTQIEGTNIWYYDYEAEHGAKNSGEIKGYDDVVFVETEQNDYKFFYNNKAARRGDFNHSLPMFVPINSVTETKNGTKYYNSGYWMNYPENTGYSLLIYNQKAKDGAVKLYEYPFEFTEDFTMPMELVVDLEAGQTYGFEIKRTDGTYYSNTGTMTANTTNWSMSKDQSSYCGLQTTAAGNYTFRLYYSSSSYRMDVTYPVAVNDYRIVYTDLATWSKDAHTASWNHPSRVITKNSSATETKKDTVSFFWTYGSSPAIAYQTCSAVAAGSASWSAGTSISVSSYSSVLTKKGIYNFIFEQPAGGASISLVGVEPYTGNFYIRTDCAGSTKWSNFQSIDHQMTYSDYAEANSGYTHYYTHWVTTGQNVKFCIANDYSPCITDTLVEDKGTVIADITTEGNANAGRLNSGNASIRFMWDQAINKISRAYISGSSTISDRFLVLEGDAKMFDASGNPLSISGLNANEINLVDDQNFVYEREIKVQTGAKAKLTAKYNSNIQYFKGGSGTTSEDSVELLGGAASATKHTMRIVYDFKTNRLMTAFVPTDTIKNAMAINADLMIVREHQEAGQQLIFNGGSLSKVHTVYGVMRFNRWTLNNKEKTGSHDPVGDPKSSYERGLYWISFPFDVNLSDVFGFGTYGTHWIIMEYDGAERAQKGYWADSKGFWKYVTNRNGKVLEAGKGYVLALDLDLMKSDNTSFWTHNIEQVELFFPSASYVSNITATDVKTTADRHLYDAAAHPGHTDDRTYKDSHWNMIGVPSYANYGETLTSDGEEAVITWSTPTTADLPYLYEWNAVDNTYTVQTGSTYPFKSMHAYMVQYHGDMYWHLASATPPSSPAPLRYEGALNPVEFRLELQQNEKMVDQTFVKMSNEENVSAGFAFDEDLSKEFNANKANIYTIVESNMPIAGNVQPMSEQTTVVPVGVKIATNGEYTFAMPDGTEGIGITLVDNETGIRTSLSALDYTVNLNAGTYNERFVLEISPIHHMPTGIEEVSGERLEVSGARKLMIDGILYIVKDGKMFDARGARVK